MNNSTLYYKLTTQNCITHNDTVWIPGVEVRAFGHHNDLCSNGWIHFYRSPLVAVLRNPKDANIYKPRLWLFRSTGVENHEALKSGTRSGYIVSELPLPIFTLEQRVAWGILCTLQVHKESSWTVWANNWLAGVDRTADAARVARVAADAAYAAAYADAAYAAAYAAAAADAAYAAYAADAAAYAAHAAHAAAAAYAAAAAAAAYAAAAAAYAAADRKLNFHKLAQKALTYK